MSLLQVGTVQVQEVVFREIQTPVKTMIEVMVLFFLMLLEPTIPTLFPFYWSPLTGLDFVPLMSPTGTGRFGDCRGLVFPYLPPGPLT